MTKAKLIACILSAVMILSAFALCIIPASASGDGTALVYTAIGDSIAAGYKLPNYTADGATPSDGYVAQFAASIGATKINDKAVTGSDTNNTLTFLQLSAYADAVAEADVISISMGSNDILGPGQQMIAESLGLTSTSEIAGAFASTGANPVDLLKTISDYVKLDAQAARFEAAVEGFYTNWVAIIDKIVELNPDVKIVVNNYYNPYKPMSSLAYYGVDIDKTVDLYLDQMNEFITSHEYNGTKYVIADVTAVGVDKTNVNLILRDVDPHPNTEGHAYIATQVLAAYNTIGESGTDTEEVTTEATTEEITTATDTDVTETEPSDNTTSNDNTPSDTEPSPTDPESSTAEDTTETEPSGDVTTESNPTDTDEKTTADPDLTTAKPDLDGIGFASLLGCGGGDSDGAAIAAIALAFALSVGTAVAVVIKKK